MYINQETSEVYRILFERAFGLLSEKSGKKPVCFHYLHKKGFKAIIVDMDSKQMSGEYKPVITDYNTLITFIGLGAYLKMIDPLHRPWTWQLQNVLMFCRAHFQRSIDQIVSPSEQLRILDSIMVRLLDCSSHEYTKVIDLLKGIQ